MSQTAAATSAAPDRQIRLADVKDITGLASSTIYKFIAAGEFPPGAKYGTARSSARRWSEREVRAWVASKAIGGAA